MFFMSKDPIVTRRETEIFQGFFIQGKYSNISEFLYSSDILTFKPSFIPESPKYSESNITSMNKFERLEGDVYQFTNKHPIYRYANFVCPFYVKNNLGMKFEIKIESSQQDLNNFNSKGESLFENYMQNFPEIPPEVLKFDFSKNPSFEYDYELEAESTTRFLLKNIQEVSFTLTDVLRHHVLIKRSEKDYVIWVRDVVSPLNYNFYEQGADILIVVFGEKKNKSLRFIITTLNHFLLFNLDTSADQGTFLIANLIAMIILGIVNIIIKLRHICLAKKKKKQKRNLSAYFNQSQKATNSFNNDNNSQNEGSKRNSNENKEMKYSNMESSSSEQNDNFNENIHFNVPADFQN
jgi:hypothetical protein